MGKKTQQTPGNEECVCVCGKKNIKEKKRKPIELVVNNDGGCVGARERKKGQKKPPELRKKSVSLFFRQNLEKNGREGTRERGVRTRERTRRERGGNEEFG